MACWIPAHGQVCRVMRLPQETGSGIMLSGVLAVLIVGTLAGSIEADRGDGCYRTSCYQRYDRGYYDGGGGCGGYSTYGGCGGYRGYADCGYGGYAGCGYGYRGCSGYGGGGDYGGYGGYRR